MRVNGFLRGHSNGSIRRHLSIIPGRQMSVLFVDTCPFFISTPNFTGTSAMSYLGAKLVPFAFNLVLSAKYTRFYVTHINHRYGKASWKSHEESLETCSIRCVAHNPPCNAFNYWGVDGSCELVTSGTSDLVEGQGYQVFSLCINYIFVFRLKGNQSLRCLMGFQGIVSLNIRESRGRVQRIQAAGMGDILRPKEGR